MTIVKQTLIPLCYEGTNHLVMWVYYTDNSNGVCMVMDKDTFAEKNKLIFFLKHKRNNEMKY